MLIITYFGENRMRFRWAIKELQEIDDYDFLEKLCIERQSDCTNIYSPLYKKLAEVIARLHIRIEEQEEKQKEKEKEDSNNHITILLHNISYYLDDNSEIQDGDCEYEHIIYMIQQGYTEGELVKGDSEDNDKITNGYWEIVR